jgi:hypothetical protein
MLIYVLRLRPVFYGDCRVRDVLSGRRLNPNTVQKQCATWLFGRITTTNPVWERVFSPLTGTRMACSFRAPPPFPREPCVHQPEGGIDM